MYLRRRRNFLSYVSPSRLSPLSQSPPFRPLSLSLSVVFLSQNPFLPRLFWKGRKEEVLLSWSFLHKYVHVYRLSCINENTRVHINPAVVPWLFFQTTPTPLPEFPSVVLHPFPHPSIYSLSYFETGAISVEGAAAWIRRCRRPYQVDCLLQFPLLLL